MKKQIALSILALGMLGTGCTGTSDDSKNSSQMASTASLAGSGSQNPAPSLDSSSKSDSTEPNTTGTFQPLASQPASLETMFDSIALDGSVMVDAVSGVDGKFFFQTLQNGLSPVLFPTSMEYAWDSRTGMLETLKTRDPQSLARVWDFCQKDGVLYESVLEIENDQLLNNIYANDQLVFSKPCAWFEHAARFAFVGGKLQFLTAYTENDQSHLLLASLDHDQVEEIYRLDGDGSTREENLQTGILHQQSPGRICFLTTNNGEQTLVFYDGNSILEAPFEGRVWQIVPLQSGTLVCQAVEDEAGNYLYPWYWYPAGSQEASEIGNWDQVPLLDVNAGAEIGDSFYITGTEGLAYKISYASEGLTLETIDTLPSYYCSFFRLDQDYPLIFIDGLRQPDGTYQKPQAMKAPL